MEKFMNISGRQIPVTWHSSIVVGSGAAGYNAANRLVQFGEKDIALLTENRKGGTSRNTGSDKQTYYKLTLSGAVADSVEEMGKTLYEGKAVDGAISLSEAASSVQSFLNLVELGVPFPRNRYGGFVGYKTDHDPRERGTSVGPLTSRQMTEKLEEEAKRKGIKILDNHLVIGILQDHGQYKGVLVLDTAETDPAQCFKLFGSHSIIYATGGPANIYKDSVFPHGHYGMSGIAFEAGVMGRNLTEWQYGLASTHPRWNVSGTYMQVLPRLISTDQAGDDEREFLSDYFTDPYLALSKLFLKGYQWPFDIRKADSGSSIIDLLVYTETKIKGRRVFLDYRTNPFFKNLDFSQLDSEAGTYLKNTHADFGTPIQRLREMNEPAYEFYKNRGVDLQTDMLEIALCAQHNNGGLAMDEWWQTNIEGFFAAGEVAGSHGIYRPGGSALNAGQVGSLRAARYIAAHRKGRAEPQGSTAEYFGDGTRLIEQRISMIEACFNSESNVSRELETAQMIMSEIGGPIRNNEQIKIYLGELRRKIANFSNEVKISSHREVQDLVRLYDVYISQYMYLSAMKDYSAKGRSRGSSLYFVSDGHKPMESLDDRFRYHLDNGMLDENIQEVVYDLKNPDIFWRKRAPFPEAQEVFENVWKNYRTNENIN